MVPATPGSELYKQLKEIAEKEADVGIRFRVQEIGGRTIKRQVQISNPTKTPGCSSNDCLACVGGGGGNCRTNNVEYEMACQQCPEDWQTVYLGETARNGYTRSKEHMSNYKNKKKGGKKESFIFEHQSKSILGSTLTSTSKLQKGSMTV